MMNRTLKLVLFLWFACSICSAQIELMQNNYPTNPGGNPFPDAEMKLYACLTGSAAGVNNVPIFLDWHQYHGWGTHIHEIGGVERYQPLVLGGVVQLTGNGGNPAGCVNWDVMLNGIAGGYTFTASSPGFPTKGINYITRYYVVNGVRTPQYFIPYTGGCWQDDPSCPGQNENLAINKPYDLHKDTRHLTVYGPWHSYIDSSRYVSPDVNQNFRNMSSDYKALTGQQLAGQYDLLDITRISLPDGGIYDNDVNGIAPGPDQSIGDWNARLNEEHARGVEADIYVPSGTLRQDIAFASITSAGCYLGLYPPNGTDPIGTKTQTENYWRSKFIMHVSCRPGHAIPSGGHRAN